MGRPAYWMRIVLACLLFSITGCEDRYPEELEYYFSPHTRRPDPQTKKPAPDELTEAQLKPEAQRVLGRLLKPIFGTPAHPKVDLAQADDTLTLPDDPELAGLDAKTLEEGSRLYRRFCIHCHGIVGDGRGSTGRWLNPPPRDFRTIWFKFRSTYDPSGAVALPSREDLRRTIHNGIPGASMPSFALLSERETEAIISYVIHLNMRGRMEHALGRILVEQSDLSSGETEASAALPDILRVVVQSWTSQKKLVKPVPAAPRWPIIETASTTEEAAALMRRARDLFVNKGACVQCHGVDGRGDPREVPDNAVRRDFWGNPLLPRDLTHGVFRGGSRPQDLFWRIRLGIAGTDMPATEEKQLSDEEVWLLVNYVLDMARARPAVTLAE
ncbi:MAG: cytochrome c [Gemmatales bacterium]|nr:cytochrome c [Gemmatales bacterium]MCS7158915.1 cytochrome c [Gemmatales bacterium]MDW8174114.1 cytochrome c [Gemmatales bacterium]MDW8221402.1 cytochrome c [Gemmatales bacterium]